MFQIDEQTATLVSVNPRAEKHGDQNVAAVDLGITFDAVNDLLFHFGQWLLPSLYFKEGKETPPPVQGELEEIPAVSSLPNLRNPCIEPPIKLVFEGVGYTAVIDYGLGKESDIRIGDVKVNSVKIVTKEGGTVTYSMRIQVSEPDEEDLGALCMMVGNKITISLKPPKAGDQKTMEAV